MIRRLSLILGIAVASSAWGQNQPTIEQLQKDLNNTQELLKIAQDRKNELSIDNQNLHKRIAELEQKLSNNESLLAQGYILRQQDQLWKQFMDLNPNIKAMWTEFIASMEKMDLFPKILGNPNWPFGD